MPNKHKASALGTSCISLPKDWPSNLNEIKTKEKSRSAGIFKHIFIYSDIVTVYYTSRDEPEGMELQREVALASVDSTEVSWKTLRCCERLAMAHSFSIMCFFYLKWYIFYSRYIVYIIFKFSFSLLYFIKIIILFSFMYIYSYYSFCAYILFLYFTFNTLVLVILFYIILLHFIVRFFIY